MQAKTKKWIIGSMAIVLSIILVTGLWMLAALLVKGCGKSIENRIKQTEDFEYYYYSYNGEKRVGIKGFARAITSEEVLIIPKQINGCPVSRFLYDDFGWGTHKSHLYSDNLKRLYLPHLYFDPATFVFCSRMEKLIFYQCDSGYCDEYIQNNEIQSIKAYIKSFGYNQELYNKTNVCSNNEVNVSFYFANVSYMYNYETEENDGYYWIDDYDYGTTITYEPQEPKREGYTFGGWYREPECINKWDFAVDTLPQEITEEEEDAEGNLTTKVIYQETRLYAKWLGN